MARQSNNKLLVIIAIAVVGLIIILVVLKKQGVIGGEEGIKVEVAEAKKSTIVEKVSASGMVQPVNEVKISPDVSGEIIELNVEEGDSVKQGQVLIKIRPDIYQSNLERAIANLNQQKANLANARAQLESAKAQFIRDSLEFARNQNLYEEEVISDSDYQLSRANFEVSQSNYKAAQESVQASRYIVRSSEAAVSEARENLRFTTITAPVTGTVSKLSVELGERVVGTSTMTGTEMLRIANLEHMEARVDVNENDIIRVALGDSATIDVDAYSHTGRKFKGIVTQIANTANDKASPDAVTEFEVRIKLLNKSYEDLLKDRNTVSPFRPGMTASVDIITEIKRNVLTVPLSAVTTRDPEDKDSENEEGDSEQQNDDNNDSDENSEIVEVVFKVKDGKAEKVSVETGISDFNNIEILEGIELGETVVTGPFVLLSKQLKDEDLVNVEGNEKKGDEGETD